MEKPSSDMVCQQEFNVDTCWSAALHIQDEDPELALLLYDKSCDFQSQFNGCYEAGRIYLHNPTLRNYARAKERFEVVCEKAGIGFGPYGCKFLGWMYHAGIGVEQNQDRAIEYLSRSCFFSNDLFYTDAEGCHFLAESIRLRRRSWPADYIAYLALSMGCLDRAEGVCKDAIAAYQQAEERSSSWIDTCNNSLPKDALPVGFDCSGFPRPYDFVEEGSEGAYEFNRLLRSILHDQAYRIFYRR